MSARLSIVIPAFNAEMTLAAAIASARAVGDVEVVVVDDGSTDSTAAVAEKLADRVVQQTNSGAAAARRAGAAGGSSEFIAFLDADDEVVAEGVAQSLRLLDASASTAVAAGRVVGIWPDGSERMLDRTYAHVDAASLVEQGFGPWPPAAAVFRRETYAAAMAAAPARLETAFAEDYEMLIRVAMHGGVSMHETIAARYRIFDGKSSKLPVQAIEAKEQIRAHYAAVLGLDIPLMSRRQILASARFKAGRTAQARGHRVRAIRYSVGGVLLAPDLAFRGVSARMRRRAGGRKGDS